MTTVNVDFLYMLLEDVNFCVG